jgi:hypothetical protein
MPILRPSNPLTETVAQMTVSDYEIRLILDEVRDEFRLTMRALNYQWRPWPERFWQRLITPENGPLQDRAIEAAYRLLAAGFILNAPDVLPMERILAGQYAEERTRWILARTTGPFTGWFAIRWGRQEDFYARAKRLTGARYSKPCVIVPMSQFEEVQDFAGLHDFQFSKSAQELLSTAIAARQQMIRVELQPRAVAAPTVAPVEVSGEIAPEFRDDI